MLQLQQKDLERARAHVRVPCAEKVAAASPSDRHLVATHPDVGHGDGWFLLVAAHAVKEALDVSVALELVVGQRLERVAVQEERLKADQIAQG